jgi:hypothetical protein
MLQTILDKAAIVDVITSLFVSTDRRAWADVRACFTGTVLFDMTSLAGGAPGQATPEMIASGWEAGLRPIQSIHHQVGNFQVSVAGDEADADCYGIAYHHRPTKSGRSTRVFVGTYTSHLVRSNVPAGWLIDRFRFDVKFVDGNLKLEEEE